LGGEILIARARAVLKAAFPSVARRMELRVTDEQFRRLGQAAAAAILPELRK
jgi:hypothetical protein